MHFSSSIVRPMLLAIFAICCVTLYNLTPSFNTYDTSYYICAGEKLLSGGGLDCLRTPVYPLFLQLCGYLGEHILNLPNGMNIFATIFQSMLFLISVYSLYDTCRRVLNWGVLSFLITLYYILIPAAGWANEMLTESPSVSLCVILTHWIICFVQKPSLILNIAIHVLLAIMTLLRPNFIAFFVILPTLYVYQWIKTKEKAYALALMLTILPIGCYAGYCYAYRQQYGLYTSSFASKCNVYFLWENNLWNPNILEDTHEKKICLLIEKDNVKNGGYSGVYNYIDTTCDLASVAHACHVMSKQNRLLFIKNKVRLFTNSAFGFMMPWTYNHGGISSFIHQSCHLIALPVSFIYFITFAFAVAIIIFWIHRKVLPVIAALLWAIVATQVVGIALAGSDSFSRLLMPFLPMALVLTGMGVESIQSRHEQ